jgi:ubiquinone/menaquinone biosynthesis C-methylase UbiE
MHRIHKEKTVPVDQKIYEYLAEQIVQDYGITEGRCLDIGTGQGNMGLAVAKRTQLQMCLLDVKEESLALALASSRDMGMSSRVTVIKSPVETLPFLDNYFNLIVSRGSIFFWESQTVGIKEAFRVLAPGGVAYIGGGTSRLMPQEEREAFFQWARPRHRDTIPDWEKKNSVPYLTDCLQDAGVKNFKITKETGTWIEFRK